MFFFQLSAGLPEQRSQMGDSECHTPGSVRAFVWCVKHTSLILPWLAEVWGICSGGTVTVGLLGDAGGNTSIKMEAWKISLFRSLQSDPLRTSNNWSSVADMTNLCYRGDDGVTRHTIHRSWRSLNISRAFFPLCQIMMSPSLPHPGWWRSFGSSQPIRLFVSAIRLSFRT